jgi:hypothetical protein
MVRTKPRAQPAQPHAHTNAAEGGMITATTTPTTATSMPPSHSLAATSASHVGRRHRDTATRHLRRLKWVAGEL